MDQEAEARIEDAANSVQAADNADTGKGSMVCETATPLSDNVSYF